MTLGPEVRRDRWSAAALTVLAAAYLAVNRQYPLDSLAAPGPGVFPLTVGVALLVLAGWQALAPARGQPDVTKAASRGRRGPVLMIGLLLLYAAGLSALGFLVTSFLFVLVAARLMGAPDWWRPVLLALGVTLGTYVVFVAWLGVPLPAGLLR
jgi:putative tricarboxylic transport membrane protein